MYLFHTLQSRPSESVIIVVHSLSIHSSYLPYTLRKTESKSRKMAGTLAMR